MPKAPTALVQRVDRTPYGRGQAPLSREREYLRRWYVALRHETGSETDALEAMLYGLREQRAELPNYVPYVDRGMVAEWAVVDQWEAAYYTQYPEDKTSPAETAVLALRLQDYYTLVRQSRELLDNAYEKAAKPEATAGDAQRFRAAYQTWQDAVDRSGELAERIEIDTARRQRAGMWDAQRTQVYSELVTEYGDLGPHYRLLIQRLAATEIRLRQLEGLSTPEVNKEYTDLSHLHVALIGQLQKYTEAVKTELINSRVNDAVLKVLMLIEAKLKDTQPALWRSIVEEIQNKIG